MLGDHITVVGIVLGLVTCKARILISVLSLYIRIFDRVLVALDQHQNIT